MADGDSNQNTETPEPEDEVASLMYVRCSVCGEWMDVKPGKLNWVSHGLCPACHKSEIARIGLILEERRKQRERKDCDIERNGPNAAPSSDPPA